MKSETVRALFNDLSPNYDYYNRIFSLGIDTLWRKHLVRAVADHQPSTILDVACGSGDVALALQKALPSAQITGLDFSAPLLAQAQARGLRHVVQGDALNLPFPDRSFSAATLAFGLRNFSDRARGLREIARVLQPGGVFGLLEFNPPPMPWKIFWDLYLHQIMPCVAQLLTRQGDSFRYLAQSISGFPRPPVLDQELASAGLKLLDARLFSARLVRCTISIKS